MGTETGLFQLLPGRAGGDPPGGMLCLEIPLYGRKYGKSGGFFVLGAQPGTFVDAILGLQSP